MQKEERLEICRLCFKQCEDDFDLIEDSTKEILCLLLLKLDLDVCPNPLMCKSCSKHLQSSYDFKLACLCTEDCIKSFVNDANEIKPDLTQIYARKNNNSVSDGDVVCRLCMGLVKCTGIFLNHENKHAIMITVVLGTFLPELDLNITENPTVCTSCHTFLQKHDQFLISCLSIEQKIKKYCEIEGRNGESQINLERVIYFEPTRNEENTEIKVKEENTAETDTEEFSIKQEEVDLKPDQNDLSLENGAVVSQNTSQVATFQCEICTFTTKYKHSIKNHMEVHKSASERPTYLCELCSYKTARRSTLKQHIKLKHKDASEITIYKCDVCSYECKRKSYLTYHMLTHKNDSEVVMFKCQACTFETKYKRDLIRHMLTHKSVSEVTMYKCQVCSFETKHKGSLKYHMDIHKDPAEVKEFECGICSFKTRYKWYLKRHRLTHPELN